MKLVHAGLVYEAEILVQFDQIWDRLSAEASGQLTNSSVILWHCELSDAIAHVVFWFNACG